MERSQKSRTGCFPICRPCSCCECGKSSLELGVLGHGLGKSHFCLLVICPSQGTHAPPVNQGSS